MSAGAAQADLPAVREHIADHTGTGSGTGGGDAFLLSEFARNAADPGYTK
jgi:hypothetical protein